jgi:hypothetical protein
MQYPFNHLFLSVRISIARFESELFQRSHFSMNELTLIHDRLRSTVQVTLRKVNEQFFTYRESPSRAVLLAVFLGGFGFVLVRGGFPSPTDFLSFALPVGRQNQSGLVYVAIISSDFTSPRLELMCRRIFTDSLFAAQVFRFLVLYPREHGPPPCKIPFVVTSCSSSTSEGICCRVDIAMRLFLETESPWFIRVIDDSWFNPGNLYKYVWQLSAFCDPFQHVVIKGHMDPYFLQHWGFTFLQGGAPILMSRAGVQHVLAYFLQICGTAYWPADDITIGLIVNRTFESFSHWADVHFAGAIPSGKSTFHREWDLGVRAHFSGVSRSCDRSHAFQKPLKDLIGVHSWGGIRQWRSLVELCTSPWFPDDLMFEYLGDRGYTMCRDPSEVLRFRSQSFLESHTPKLVIGSPFLNFSVCDLWEWGFQHIPRLPWLPGKPLDPRNYSIREGGFSGASEKIH